MRYAYANVHRAVTDRLCDLGFSEQAAGATAAVLLEAEVRGYPTQGLRRLDEIAAFVQRGLIEPSAIPQWSHPRTASAIAKADRCLGHPIAIEAVTRACELAATHGIAMAGVVGASHIGYMTHYVERAAEQGFLAIATTVSSPAVSLPGSGSPLLGTNPLAYAFPYEGGILCADLSLASVSRGTVIAAKEAGTQMPAGSGYDSSGNPSTDPRAILDGGIAPLGDSVRGLLVNLLFSVLAGPLIGAPANHEVVGTRWATAAPNKGDFFLCIDIAAATSIEVFGGAVGDLLAQMMGQQTAFHVPGDTSRRVLQSALQHGVDLAADTASKLGLREAAA